MALSSQVTDTVVIADDIEVTVRKLGWGSLQNAKEKALPRLLQQMELAEQYQKMQQAPAEPAEPTDEQKRELRQTVYDKQTVLVAGIAKWGFDAKPRLETILDLDEADSDLLYHRILDLSGV